MKEYARTQTVFKKGSLEACIRYMIENEGKKAGRQLAIIRHAGISGPNVVDEEEAVKTLKEEIYVGYQIVLSMSGLELKRFVGYAQLNLFPGGEVGDDQAAI